MRTGLIVGMFVGMGLLLTMAVNLTETPKQEVGFYDDVVTAKGPVYNVLAYGAIGDGTTDDTTAIQAAIDATPVGGKCFLPVGIYRITATLTRSTPIEFCGASSAAILKPDMTASDDLLYFGSASTGSYGYYVHDFTIASSASNVCLNAIKMERTYDSVVDNVNVICGHANAALLLSGATCTRVRHFGTGYTNVITPYTRGAIGIELEDSTVQCNDIVLDVFINIMSDIGIKMTSSLAANNVKITGAVQNCTNYGLYVDGMWLVETDKLYTEVVTKNKFIDCKDLYFRTTKEYQTGETWYLEDCNNVIFDSCVLRNVDVDGDCYGVVFKNTHIYGTKTGNGFFRCLTQEGITNNSATAFNGSGIISNGDLTNYCQNTDFVRWTSTAPEGWSKPAAATWTHCGVGMADTTTLITDNCAKVVFTSYSASAHTLWDTSTAVNALIQAGTGSFSIWCRTDGTPSNYPTVRIRVVDGAGNRDYYTQTLTEDDTWIHLTRTFPVYSGTTDIQIGLYCYGTCYINAPVLQAGHSASRSWSSSPDDFTASPRSPQVYNVLKYGAKGDGSTDDTAAIQAAEGVADDNGGIVYFPPGDYDINGNVTISSNVSLQFSAGAKISVSDTYTLTFANATQIIAPLGNDCFDLEGSGAVAYTAQTGFFSQAWTDGTIDNFGINTTDPNTAFDVEGTITANAAIIDHGITVKNGTSPGFININEGSGGGTNKVIVTGPSALSGDVTATFPETTGTIGVWLSGSATWDPASLDDGVGETSAGITVTGAAIGDFVIASAPYDLQDMTVTAYVQAANTVEIRLQNESGGTKDLASGTWKVKVMKQ